MQLCHAQALLARNTCPPNPAVGAVLVDVKGSILGVGHTQRRGGPHAEIMAIRHAREQGYDLSNATLYVSLEPCSHHGHTPPCTDAIIEAGVKKVVASILDPNPIVSGRGVAKLRSAGIEVAVGTGAIESRELNIGFFSRMIRKRPWVRLKIAATLDGRVALEDGTSQWITSEPARKDGQQWRAKACAILTGIGTILKDDPKLDVRLENTGRQPDLYIIDSHLKTPKSAQIFLAQRKVTIYCAHFNEEKKYTLEAQGAKVICMPSLLPDGTTKVDLIKVFHDLSSNEINELHVEAGPRLNGTLIEAGLIDEIILYQAPKLIGRGLPMADMSPIGELCRAVNLKYFSIEQISTDMRIICRVSGHGDF